MESFCNKKEMVLVCNCFIWYYLVFLHDVLWHGCWETREVRAINRMGFFSDNGNCYWKSCRFVYG